MYSVTKPSTRGSGNAIDNVTSAMQDFIPVDVTAFYIGFKAVLSTDLAKTALPLLALALTLFLRWTRTDEKDLKTKEGKIRYGLILVPAIALIGWIYVLGDTILGISIGNTEIIALVFAAFNIALPPVYRAMFLNQKNKEDNV